MPKRSLINGFPPFSRYLSLHKAKNEKKIVSLNQMVAGIQFLAPINIRIWDDEQQNKMKKHKYAYINIKIGNIIYVGLNKKRTKSRENTKNSSNLHKPTEKYSKIMRDFLWMIITFLCALFHFWFLNEF